MHGATKVLAAAAVAAWCSPAVGSVRTFGRQVVKSPLWAGPLEEFVNSPLRVSGNSSLSRTEFYFDGNSEQVNELIAEYARLESAHVYLAVTTDTSHSAVLQVRHHGDGGTSLTVNVRTEEAIEALKLPAGLEVEALPPIGEWIDPVKREAQRALTERVRVVVADRD
jgi:hypothetical protein